MTRLIILASIAVGVLLFATGCQALYAQYDNTVANCAVANAEYEIVIEVSRDSSTTDNDRLPQAFLDACKLIGAGPLP